MHDPRLALLLVLPLAAGCVIDREWDELDLTRAPFFNPHLPSGTTEATVTVEALPGFTCPDGKPARAHVVEDPTRAPRGTALFLHGYNFDYVTTDGSHYAPEDRLTSSWASTEVEEQLGLRWQPGSLVEPEGAWAAELVKAGWVVIAPGDCFGDLWHGRGQNDYDEGFLRQGAWLAQDSLRLRDTPGALLGIGLGEGGRGLVELLQAGVDFDAVVLDSTPDWLSPVLSQPTQNAAYIGGLQAIYHSDLPVGEDAETRMDALRQALRRDSFVTLAEQGWEVPVVYAWSEFDERIDSGTSQPGAQAIAANYPDGLALVQEWLGDTRHAPSNRVPDEVARLLDWLDPFLPAPPPTP